MSLEERASLRHIGPRRLKPATLFFHSYFAELEVRPCASNTQCGFRSDCKSMYGMLK
jgi:hypothetical protein